MLTPEAISGNHGRSRSAGCSAGWLVVSAATPNGYQVECYESESSVYTAAARAIRNAGMPTNDTLNKYYAASNDTGKWLV